MASVFLSKNARSTRRAAELLGEEIRRYARDSSGAFILALSGDLGAGKTTFTKALGKSLGVRSHMHSPTFVLMKRYPIRVGAFKNVWHIDCYRIDDPKELRIIGFRDMLKDPKNIIVVEWAEKIRSLLKKERVLWIQFSHKSSRERTLSFYTTV